MGAIDFIKIPLQVLATVGLRMSNASGTKDVYLINSNWFFSFAIISTVVHVTGQGNGALLRIQNGDDLSIVGHYIFPLFYAMSAISKALSVLLKRESLNKLLIELDDIYPKTLNQRIDYQLNACLNYVTKLAIVCAIFQIFSLQYISWSSIIIQYFEMRGGNETFHIPLPYGDEYPFYRDHPVSFVLMFISQCLEAYICASTVYSVNFLFCGIVSQILMHYEHLNWKLKSFREQSSSDNEHQHLAWCISKHDQLNK